MADIDAIALAAAVGVRLPAAYLALLDRLDRHPAPDDDAPALDHDGQTWHPHSRRKLADIVPHRRREGAFPYARETARHAELLAAADAEHDGEASASLLEQGFPLDRLARGFCVGSDENGDPLFVDPDTGGVFLFCHDGADVEPWAPSLADLVAASVDAEGEDDDDVVIDDDEADDDDEEEARDR